jgi:uncharacterized protein YbaP (TraB family)
MEKKIMKKRKRLLVIAAIFIMLTTLLGGCSSRPASIQPPVTEQKKYGDIKGCLWEIKNDKATVYLFGSIHIAKKDMYPFDKTVEEAFENSNNLVVEVDVTNTNNVNNSQSKLFYPENDDVYNHISKEGKEKLDSYAKELGMDMNALKKMKLWVIESAMQQALLQKSGYSSSDGVDMYFLKAAKNKKKILELESIDFQFDLLNSFSQQSQEAIFFKDIKDLKDCNTEFEKLYEAYRSADEKTLTEMIVDSSKDDPESYSKLLVDRNVGMANKIDEYLKTSNSYFVVVGLGHFLGEDSVVKLLEEKGYTVTRK